MISIHLQKIVNSAIAQFSISRKSHLVHLHKRKLNKSQISLAEYCT